MSMTRHEIIQTVRPLNTWILFRLDFGPFVVNWGINGTFESVFFLDILGNCVLYQYLMRLSEYKYKLAFSLAINE